MAGALCRSHSCSKASIESLTGVPGDCGRAVKKVVTCRNSVSNKPSEGLLFIKREMDMLILQVLKTNDRDGGIVMAAAQTSKLKGSWCNCSAYLVNYLIRCIPPPVEAAALHPQDHSLLVKER